MSTSASSPGWQWVKPMLFDRLGMDEALAGELLRMLESLKTLRVACIGDLMIDLAVDCTGARISPEAPVIVVAEQQQHACPGGAGNVAVNLAALGCMTNVCGLIGQDDDGVKLASLLNEAEVELPLRWMMVKSRPTTRKTRFVSGGQQLLRVDRETSRPLDMAEALRLKQMISALPSPLHSLLVSDYGKGVVTPEIMNLLRERATKEACLILVDPKGCDWLRYGAVDIIKPNASELATFAGLPCADDEEVELALKRAIECCAARMILVTRAGDGASLISRETMEVRHFSAYRVNVADVCGAGDTNLAMLGVSLAAGLDIDQAVAASQFASSLAVQRRGNAVIDASTLVRLAKKAKASRGEGKVVNLASLKDLIREWRATGLKVGMTNGCFDLLHSGHVRMLQYLKEHCDRVVVALNSDESVRRLKGATRPLVNESERAAVLAAMSVVDAVTIFDEDTPEQLIRQVKPEVLCKGGDYKLEEIVGSDFVQSAGGKVIISDFEQGISTTSLVERIIQVHSYDKFVI